MMIDHHPDAIENAEPTGQDLALAALIGRYIERREHDETPRVHDLLAAAAEFGDTAVDVLRTVLACYEVMRAHGETPPAPDPRPTPALARRHRMPQPNHDRRPGSLESVAASGSSPTVVEVLGFERLPLGSRGSRRAVVRWSDGTESAALTWYADEILICEGDHGNSRLMSPRAEMHRAAGSVRVPRGT